MKLFVCLILIVLTGCMGLPKKPKMSSERIDRIMSRARSNIDRDMERAERESARITEKSERRTRKIQERMDRDTEED